MTGRRRATFRLFAVGAVITGCTSGRAAPESLPPAPLELTMAVTAFQPPVVRVPVGAPATLLVRNNDPQGHDVRVDDIGVHLSVGAGEQVRTALFVALPAAYPFYCSIPGHRAAGMVGTLWAG